MNKPHKHAEIIKAWADGAKIEFRSGADKSWYLLDSTDPYWIPGFEYRIKPPRKTPGQVFFEAIRPKAQCDWKDVFDKNYFDTGAQAVIEAYKRGMVDEVQDKGDDLR